MFCNCYTRVFKCFRCFCKCFRRMLQVFHLDVSKADRDAAHVAMRPTCHNFLLQLLGRRACAWERRDGALLGGGSRKRRETAARA
jgi:hypothetical protein